MRERDGRVRGQLRASSRARRLMGGVCAVVAMLLGGCGNTLPDDPAGLPYVLEKFSAKSDGALDCEFADLDGDGVDEMVTVHAAPAAAYYYIGIRRIREDNILIMKQWIQPWLHRLSGVDDVDGDGLPEILITTQVGTEWGEIRVLDVEIAGDTATVDTLRTAEPIRVPLPPTLISGVLWDGRLMTHDLADLDGDGFRETLTFSSRAGVAKGPRGIGRGNLKTGELLWFARFAGVPDELACVADLDGDGEHEYVASFNSPCNGVMVGDMTDSEAFVGAVDGDGTVMWKHRVAGRSASGWPYCGDVTGDGRIEVVTWYWHGTAAGSDTTWLTVRDGASGQRLGGWANEGNIYSVELGDTEDPGAIYVGSEDGRVRRLRWTGSAFEVEREIECRGTPQGIALVQIPPLEQPALVCMTAAGTVAVLDLDLRPLAVLPTDAAHDCHASIRPARFSENRRGVSIGIATGGMQGALLLELHRAPIPIWMLALAGSTLILLVVVGTPVLRRRALARIRRLLIPHVERETALDELLGSLVRAGHGKLAATSTLRRLRQQLTLLAGLESTPPEKFTARYREAVANVREIGVPGIVSIHNEAARVGLDPSRVATLRRELTQTRDLLRSLPGALPDATTSGRIAERLDAIGASLDDALDGVLESCRLELSSGLMKEVRRAAGVRRGDIIELGAELVVPAVSRVEEARVLGTRAEVSFIIENLLANALAAVEQSDDRRIEVTAEPEDGDVVMRISDTGTGIPPEMHERIFDDGVSGTHGGSGHGLAESRRILARRGGAISVVSSRPGRGTTFEVRFQIVDGGTS